jgi:ATP phosphoribosyltransferase
VNKLALGIPKGSLQQATIDLLAKSGWRVSLGNRSYFPEVDDPELALSICRAQEMSRYVESGTLDVGLTGRDWVLENDSKVVVVDDLIYSKTSQRPARWVLAVPADSDISSPEQLAGKKVATELVNFTRRYFAGLGVEVTVEFSWGATEAKAVSGLADAVVEVTETGSTLRAHGLKIIGELMESNAQLIANTQSWEDPWKREKIQQIGLLLKGALRAERLVGLKMNVPKERVDEVIPLLPCLNAPTVAHLYRSDWLSVEVVVERRVVRDLVPRLLACGAEGIIEYPLHKVI